MFSYSLVSEIVTSQFEKIDIYYQCDWYAYSIDIKRIFPIVIVNMQQKVVFEAFGNIEITLENCRRVDIIFLIYFIL